MKRNSLRSTLGVVLLAVFTIVLFVKARGSVSSGDAALYRAEAEAAAAATPAPVPAATAAPVSSPEPSPSPDPTPAPEPTPDPDSPEGRAAALGLPAPPDIDVTSWEFILANGDHSIEEYVPENLTVVGTNGQTFDGRIVEALEAMTADAEAQGLTTFVSSGYRSYSDQAANFTRVCNNNGCTDGKNADGFYITMPAGCSEHQTGLAADITDIYYPLKDSSIENTDLFQYMKDSCKSFGFIVRFPKDKEEITGVMYEPFHFRYVGVEAAEYIMDNGLCLEEFLALYGVE